MSNLDEALAYAALGWPVFPVWPMRDGVCACDAHETCNDGKNAGKHPISHLVPKGHTKATTDKGKIRRWWAAVPDANIGLWCAEAGLVVVDIDPRNGGDISWTELGLPDSPLVADTGGGGVHQFYSAPDVEWNGVKHRGIDLKFNGYVILPPSNHKSGGSYAWRPGCGLHALLLGLPALPDCFIDDGAFNAGGTYTDEPLTDVDDEAVNNWLEKVPDIRWSDYFDWVRIGSALHHQYRGDSAGLDIWEAHSARRPGYESPKITKEKWRTFGKNSRVRVTTFRTIIEWAKKDYQEDFDEEDIVDEFDDLDNLAAATNVDLLALVGGAAPVVDPIDLLGTEAAQPEEDAKTPEWIEKLNKRHAIAFVEGKTVVLTEKLNGGMAYGSVTDLHNFYENVRRATEKSSEPVTKAWMRHPKRRSYPNGIVFAPAGGPKGAYNHWKGFSVEPDATTGCALFLNHVRETICSGDEPTYNWVIRWFAHMVQRPWEKPGTALVLKGRKGVGKDTVGEYIGSLFPRHYSKISNSEHLYGRFNAHQEQTILLHVEEGFWAGDKKAEGSLKYVITSEQVQIEPKGVNAFQVASVLRVFISSNEDWVVPATFDERRFCVLNVSATHARDTKYFAALRHEMASGGRAALLHFLQGISLRGFDVRNPPMTDGLRDQKLQSLKNVDKWWYELLLVGELPGTGSLSFDDETGADPWAKALSVQCATLRASYRDWMRDHRYEGNLLDEARFGQRMKDLVPDIAVSRPRDTDRGRVRVYDLPSLDSCRASFDRALGAAADWADQN